VDLSTLPFDQYGRYQLIASALAPVREAFGRSLHILDVGGYFRTRRNIELLPAQAFLPADTIVVLDQPACQLPGYVQGDGRGLAFGANSFDFVISCDTLEHVPASDRTAFWNELLRVATYGVILIAPVRSSHAEAAEALVASYIKLETGEIQPQLAEHQAFGLPDPTQIRALFDALGLRSSDVPSGNIHAWVAMMIARHTKPLLYDADTCEQLDSYYTKFLAAHDNAEPAYRRLWLVEKQAAQAWFEAASAALSATVRVADDPIRPVWPDLVAWQLQITNMREAAGRAAAQQQRIIALEQEVAWRASQLQAQEQRANWLEQQLSEANRQIDAVRNSRLMKIIRRIK
jgi:hypothetical protein